MRIALYPGSFDPVTNGHLSLIHRGRQIFERLIVAVADKTSKPQLFSQEERVAMIRESVRNDPHIEVQGFSGLTVEYAAKVGASAILRGLRAVSDFEGEFQLALMNRRLNHKIETVFLITDYRWLFISSSIVKGAVKNGASVHGLVPEHVRLALEEKYDRGQGLQGTPCLAPPPGGFPNSAK